MQECFFELLIILGDVYYVQAPIYVNKQVVLTDAVRISYGMGRMRDTKSTYDVSLDRYFGGLNLALLVNQFFPCSNY